MSKCTCHYTLQFNGVVGHFDNCALRQTHNVTCKECNGDGYIGSLNFVEDCTACGGTGIGKETNVNMHDGATTEREEHNS